MVVNIEKMMMLVYFLLPLLSQDVSQVNRFLGSHSLLANTQLLQAGSLTNNSSRKHRAQVGGKVHASLSPDKEANAK